MLLQQGGNVQQRDQTAILLRCLPLRYIFDFIDTLL